MKFKAKILALALISPLLFAAPVFAKSSSYPIAAGGSCNRFHGFTAPVQGEVSVKTVGKAGTKTTYEVKVKAQSLTPGKTLQVWFGDLYINRNGRIVGCGALQAASAKVDKAGKFNAHGKVTEGTNSQPKQVFIVTSFNGAGLVSDLLYL